MDQDPTMEVGPDRCIMTLDSVSLMCTCRICMVRVCCPFIVYCISCALSVVHDVHVCICGSMFPLPKDSSVQPLLNNIFAIGNTTVQIVKYLLFQ